MSPNFRASTDSHTYTSINGFGQEWDQARGNSSLSVWYQLTRKRTLPGIDSQKREQRESLVPWLACFSRNWNNLKLYYLLVLIEPLFLYRMDHFIEYTIKHNKRKFQVKLVKFSSLILILLSHSNRGQESPCAVVRNLTTLAGNPSTLVGNLSTLVRNPSTGNPSTLVGNPFTLVGNPSTKPEEKYLS